MSKSIEISTIIEKYAQLMKKIGVKHCGFRN